MARQTHKCTENVNFVCLFIFLVENRDKPVQVINGTLFMANPGSYINLTASCIRFFMAGFMSDYKVDPNVVANCNGK